MTNISLLKNEKIAEDLKTCENQLREQKAKDTGDKKLISALINRFNFKRKLLLTLESSFNLNDKNRYDNLVINVNELSGLLAEFKSTKYIQENNEWLNNYFCQNLSKILPNYANLRKLNSLSMDECIIKFDTFLKHLKDVCKIYVIYIILPKFIIKLYN